MNIGEVSFKIGDSDILVIYLGDLEVWRKEESQ